MLTDRAVIEALRDAAQRGVKVRIWRDASEAARLSDYDVEAQLGGQVQGIELRSSAPGGELMQLFGAAAAHHHQSAPFRIWLPGANARCCSCQACSFIRPNFSSPARFASSRRRR